MAAFFQVLLLITVMCVLDSNDIRQPEKNETESTNIEQNITRQWITRQPDQNETRPSNPKNYVTWQQNTNQPDLNDIENDVNGLWKTRQPEANETGSVDAENDVTEQRTTKHPDKNETGSTDIENDVTEESNTILPDMNETRSADIDNDANGQWNSIQPDVNETDSNDIENNVTGPWNSSQPQVNTTVSNDIENDGTGQWNTRQTGVNETGSSDVERKVEVFKGFVAKIDTNRTLAGDMNKLGNETLLKRNAQCVNLSYFHKIWIEMIVNCPKYYSNVIINTLCRNTLNVGTNDDQTQSTGSENATVLNMQRLPVQDDNGTVYGNIFCAICNRVTSLHIMDVLVHCDQISHLRIEDAGQKFSLFQSSPIGKCRQIVIPTKPNNMRQCQPKPNRNVMWRQRSFRGKNVVSSSVKYPISFTVLMNFGFDGKTHVLFSNTHVEIDHFVEKKCPSVKEVFVAHSNSCRKVHCSEDYTLTRFGCVARRDKKNLDIIRHWDSGSLANLSKVAKVSLEMNITYGDLVSLMSPDLEKKIIAGISQLLNISSERIRNLTITLLNETTPGERFKLLTQPEIWDNRSDLQKYVEIIKNTRSSNSESATNGKLNLPFGTEHQRPSPKLKRLFKMKFMNKWEKTVFSTSGNNLINRRRAKKTKTKMIYPGKNSKAKVRYRGKYYFKQKHVNPIKVKSPEHGNNDTLADLSAAIRVSFLILPSRNSSTSETPVSGVMQKMREVIANEKFILILNETVIRVVNKKETDHWLGADFCFTGIPVILFSEEFEMLLPNPDEGRNVTLIYVNRTRTWYHPGQYQMSVMVHGNNDVANYDGFVIVCTMPHIANDTCRRFEVPKREYVLLANRSVTVSGKLYNTSEYSYADADELTAIEICIPKEMDHRKAHKTRIFVVVPGCDKGYEKFVEADGYLTDVLGKVSIVALALVLLTYGIFKQLRNLAGINLMNLTLALLIEETVFALGENTQVSWICTSVAVSLHYFVLSSFFWMNVMAYDVYHTFARNHFSTGKRGADKYAWRYAIYAWGAPLLIVATCVILDLTHLVNGLRIGYGKMTSNEVPQTEENGTQTNNTSNTFNETDRPSQGCWIQSPEAALVVFGVPILVIFIVNGFFFVKSIYSIQQTTRLAQLKTRRSSVHTVTGRYEVMVYVRMSLVMGFTWIFGLTSSLVSVITTAPTSAICYTVHLLAILFNICNCSHGLFIFFVFIFKKRVFYMYRALWQRIQNRSISPFLGRSVSTSAESGVL